ncbi:hypothetical protein PATSB16_10000 [Pandoraea thiooxydans]|nr:hypothetical protein PATSB16_10000 [Pandoraea thiooxydans]
MTIIHEINKSYFLIFCTKIGQLDENSVIDVRRVPGSLYF